MTIESKRYVMQFVNTDDGSRSEVFTGDSSKFHDFFHKHHVSSSLMVLVLMEEDSSGEMTFSRYPLLRVENFCAVNGFTFQPMKEVTTDEE